jgi:hypothetical protein
LPGDSGLCLACPAALEGARKSDSFSNEPYETNDPQRVRILLKGLGCLGADVRYSLDDGLFRKLLSLRGDSHNQGDTAACLRKHVLSFYQRIHPWRRSDPISFSNSRPNSITRTFSDGLVKCGRFSSTAASSAHFGKLLAAVLCNGTDAWPTGLKWFHDYFDSSISTAPGIQKWFHNCFDSTGSELSKLTKTDLYEV